MSSASFLRGQEDTAKPVPTPAPESNSISTLNSLNSSDSDKPVPVVKVLSVRGVEYAMMTITLLITASALAWVLLNLVNGSSGFNYLVVPSAALLTCLPVFGLFFVRLKKAELRNPSLRLDASKRRMSQITQMLAFLACLINLIYFIYTLMQKFSGNNDEISIGKSALSLAVVLVIAGGILVYYWFDEHKLVKNS